MFTTITLSAVLTFPPPKVEDTPPSPAEQAALAALKKIGFEVCREEDLGFPPGTSLHYRFNFLPEEQRQLTSKKLAPLANLPRTRKLIMNSHFVGDDCLNVLQGLGELGRTKGSNKGAGTL